MVALERQVEALASAEGAARVQATLVLEQDVTGYAAFLWDHMGREEGVVLPAAQKHLNSDDWATIDAAFRSNEDPRFDADTDMHYKRLFSRIVNFADDRRAAKQAA